MRQEVVANTGSEDAGDEVDEVYRKICQNLRHNLENIKAYKKVSGCHRNIFYLEVVSQISICYPIPTHVWKYPKYRVIPETPGLPEISGTRYFGLYPRVAEVVQRHKGPLPISLDWDENFKL